MNTNAYAECWCIGTTGGVGNPKFYCEKQPEIDETPIMNCTTACGVIEFLAGGAPGGFGNEQECKSRCKQISYGDTSKCNEA